MKAYLIVGGVLCFVYEFITASPPGSVGFLIDGSLAGLAGSVFLIVAYPGIFIRAILPSVSNFYIIYMMQYLVFISIGGLFGFFFYKFKLKNKLHA